MRTSLKPIRQVADGAVKLYERGDRLVDVWVREEGAVKIIRFEQHQLEARPELLRFMDEVQQGLKRKAKCPSARLGPLGKLKRSADDATADAEAKPPAQRTA